MLEAAAAVAVPAPPSPGRVREMPAAAAEIQAQEDAAAADGPGAPDDLPGPTVEGETPLPMQDPSPTLDATAAPVPTYAETTESETCSAVQEGGMPLPAAVTPEDAWLPSEAQAEDDPVAALSRAPGDVHPDVLPVSEHPSGALDVEPEDDADDLPEADPHFRLMPTPDSEAAEGQKTAAPPYPAEAPGLHRLVDQACEEMRAVARAVKAELSVLPIKVAKVLAEQVKDSSHQRHIEAINVSLASLNDAMGAIREYDFAPAMQQAVPKLWPGFNLPAEITEIKKRLSSLERVLQEERAG